MSEEKSLKKKVEETIESLLLVMPFLDELLLWVNFNVKEQFDKTDPQTYGYATQKEVFILPSATKLSPRQLATLILHESWHVALQHVAGIKRLNAHPKVANIAMDVLINEGLKNSSKPGVISFDLPPGGVDVQWLENKCKTSLPKPWNQMSWYEIYLFILQHFPREKNGLKIDKSYLPPDMPQEPITLDIDFDDDIISQPENEQENEEIEQAIWSERINRMKGNDAGDFIANFNGILPKPKKTPWPVLLRKYLTNWSLSFESEYSYSRLHRSFLTKTVPYILPTLRPNKGLIPLSIVFDTSGSISDKELLKFAAEVDKMQQDFNLQTEIWVIMVDAQVQEVTKIAENETLKDFLSKGKVNFKGRGGTSFIPGLKKAYELGTRLCIYFTDLCGDWGEKPKNMDVLWMVVGNPDNHLPDFGKIIHID